MFNSNWFSKDNINSLPSTVSINYTNDANLAMNDIYSTINMTSVIQILLFTFFFQVQQFDVPELDRVALALQSDITRAEGLSLHIR